MSTTYARLRELLDYDPLTGIFVWRPIVGRMNPYQGRNAGCRKHVSGYVFLRLDYQLYKAHRLAWLYMTGEWPTEDIDHINGDHADNRIANLRLATDSQNGANRGAQSNNTSGYKGVSWAKRERKWVARIKAEGKYRSLGYYDSGEEAHTAYTLAAHKYYGEFARVT